MDSALIFSHKQIIKCCAMLDTQIIVLICDKMINLFDIGQTKTISQYPLSQQVMPITLWVLKKQNKIIIQGKMGYNFIFNYNNYQKLISMQLKYKSEVYGFCKMIKINNKQLFGISQQLGAALIFDLKNGQLISKFKYYEQQHCQSITCIESPKEQQKQDMFVYAGQQGNKILKTHLYSNGDDSIAQCVDLLSIKSNLQVQFIQSMQFVCGKLYCITRKTSFLYILQTQPKLQIVQIIDFKFTMPRQLKVIMNKQLSLIVVDKNKVLSVNINTKTTKILVQVKQSKLIECLQYNSQNICGCTQQKQFFHIEI